MCHSKWRYINRLLSFPFLHAKFQVDLCIQSPLQNKKLLKYQILNFKALLHIYPPQSIIMAKFGIPEQIHSELVYAKFEISSESANLVAPTGPKNLNFDHIFNCNIL